MDFCFLFKQPKFCFHLIQLTDILTELIQTGDDIIDIYIIVLMVIS